MTRADLEPLRQAFLRAPVRILGLHPRGFELHPKQRLRPQLHARILAFGKARTRYHNRQPACRSLDALRAEPPPHQRCAQCAVRNRCTTLLRLDLIAERQPLHLLLQHTNATRFLLYHAQLRQRDIALEDIVHRLDVVNRGAWAELRFCPRDETT